MMNNKGLGKFEGLTIIVIVIIIVAILLFLILNMDNNQKFKTMKMSARTFAREMAANSDSFGNHGNVYYLIEGIDAKFLSKIKSPFGGNCDANESKIELKGYDYYVTLKCGNYLINDEILKADDYKIYKVSEWIAKKNSDHDQKMVRYNCEISGNKVFDTFYEKNNFIYQINKKYDTNYMNISEIRDCKVTNKVFFRTIEKIK